MNTWKVNVYFNTLRANWHNDQQLKFNNAIIKPGELCPILCVIAYIE